jgi:hypothetical protein
MHILILASHEPSYPQWHDHWAQWLVVVGLLAVALFLGSVNYQSASPFRIESTTTLSPEHTLDVLQERFARDGWGLGYRDAGTLIMTADRNASFVGTAALGCISIWLALLHLVTSRRTVTVEVAAMESANGALLVVNGSKSGAGVRPYVEKRLKDLPTA